MAIGDMPPSPNGPWPVLDVQERRILGVLVEKQKTTADAYPMSVNGLVTGSNQKSNRDPVLDLTDDDVEDTLERCLHKNLVERAPPTGRVERWRHLLYPYFQVEKVELAVLAELMLRGPQTEGELRTRASRMDPLEDLDALRALLRPLVQRNLVVYLTPEGRGAVLTHGFHDPRELDALRHRHTSGPAPQAPAHRPAPAAPAYAPPPPAPPDDRVPRLEASLAEARAEVAVLRQQVDGVRGEMADLRKQLAELRQSLGG